jgi:hypothetical protein
MREIYPADWWFGVRNPKYPAYMWVNYSTTVILQAVKRLVNRDSQLMASENSQSISTTLFNFIKEQGFENCYWFTS